MIDLVLVHGFSLDARMWEDCARHLGGVARVHPVDLPGFGTASGEPPRESIAAMAEALDAEITARGLQRFVLGGLSMGGFVSLAYWRQFRRTRGLAGLVLANTTARGDTDTGRALRDATAALLRGGEKDTVVEMMLSALFERAAERGLVGRVREMMRAQPVDSLVAALLAMRDRPDLSGELPGIEVPTLAVSGEEDAVILPRASEPLGRLIPNARWLLMPAAGHLTAMEKPEAFAAAVRELIASI